MTVARTRLTLSILLLGLLVSACNSQPAEPPTTAAQPSISDPMISDPTPQEPGKEVGISIDVSSAGGATLTYTWNADGGEIVRGQGSPAITYRVPEEPGTYNVRVKVEWDGQSTEKVTTIQVEETRQEPVLQPTATPDPTQVPTAISTSKPTPTISSNTELVYEEDFEDGRAENISYLSGNWKIIEDSDGNMVYDIDNTSSSEFPGIDFGSTRWQDYTVKYRVKILEGKPPWIITEFRRSADALYKYVLSIDSSHISLHYTTSGSNWQSITTREYNLEQGVWHSVQVEIQATNIKVSVDNLTMIDTIDSKISAGGLNIQVGPGTHAQFDDIRVTLID